MSVLTYAPPVSSDANRPLVWLHGEVRTPPLSAAARIETGLLLRRLQRGESIGLPHSRPMPSIGARCHELRIVDANATWRVVYRIDSDAVVIADVFGKKTRATPTTVIDACKRRLRAYDAAVGGKE
jgi:phage-related protein